MSLHDAKARLVQSGKRLVQCWHLTQEQWTDAKSREFEKQYLEPLGPKIAAAVSAIDRLAEVLARARRQCADDKRPIE